jgi:hemolysin activation/secretion protein
VRCSALSSIAFLRLATAHADDATSDLRRLPHDAPCFHVDRAELVGAHAERFAWLQRELDAVRGQCVGVTALHAIKRDLDARLLERGYTTSRVGFGAQDLATGTLRVQLHAGVVAEVRVDADGEPPPAAWSELFAQPVGAPFELRRLEQGLDLADRLPSQRVRVRIEPSTQPGGSVLVVERAPGAARRLHGAVRVDNGAVAAHRRARVIAALALDQPSWRNDQLTLAATSSVLGLSPQRRAQSAALGYSVPWRGTLCEIDWMAQRTARGVQTSSAHFVSSSNVEQWRAQWQWPLARSGAQRWRAHAAFTHWHAHGWLDDFELEVQRRDTDVVELGVDGLQLHDRGRSTWRVALREELGAASPGVSAVRALRAQAQYAARFGSWSSQWTASAQLGRSGMPQEECFIPGLPGFDSSQGPVAGSGAALQHELARTLQLSGDWRAAAFVDVGVARLAQAAQLLAGAAIGVQAKRGAMSLEFALAAPWRRAQGSSAAPVCSASVTAHF